MSPAYQDDTDEILRRLTDERLEEICARFWSGGVHRNGGKVYHPVPGGKGDLGSFVVYLGDVGKRKRGEWIRNSKSIGGNVINLLAYGLTNDHKAYREAFEEARGMLGMSRAPIPDEEREHRDEAAAARRKAEDEDRKTKAEADQQQREETAEYWAEFWDERVTKPIDGTLAERYLVDVRGIPRPPMGWPVSLGFVAAMPYGGPDKDRKKYPALVGRVEDAFGDTVAIHAVYLNAKTADKVDLGGGLSSKLTLGPMLGGAVRLGGDGSEEETDPCEGIETGLAVLWMIAFKRPVWCGIGTSGLGGMEFPLRVKRIRQWIDGDRPIQRKDGEYIGIKVPPGRRAGITLRDRVEPTGIKSSMCEPPAGMDWLNVFLNNMDEYVKRD